MSSQKLQANEKIDDRQTKKFRHSTMRGKPFIEIRHVEDERTLISDHVNFYVWRMHPDGQRQWFHLISKTWHDEIPGAAAKEVFFENVPPSCKNLTAQEKGSTQFRVEQTTGIVHWSAKWSDTFRGHHVLYERLHYTMEMTNSWQKPMSPLLAKFAKVTVYADREGGDKLCAFGLVVSTDGSVSLCKNSDGLGHVCATKFVQTASGVVCPFLRISSALPPSGLVEEFNLHKIAEVMCLKNKGRWRFEQGSAFSEN